MRWLILGIVMGALAVSSAEDNVFVRCAIKAKMTPEELQRLKTRFAGLQPGDCQRDNATFEVVGEDKANALLFCFRKEVFEKCSKAVNLSKEETDQLRVHMEDAPVAPISKEQRKEHMESALKIVDKERLQAIRKCMMEEVNTWVTPEKSE